MEDKKKRIYDCGKELFSSKGFKDTNISEITQMAGIAVGTFYNYYDSKEKLFMDIFLEENTQLKKETLEKLDLSQNPLDVAKQMMALNMTGMNANPILREWSNRAVFEKIEQLFLEEKGYEIVTLDKLLNVEAYK